MDDRIKKIPSLLGRDILNNYKKVNGGFILYSVLFLIVESMTTKTIHIDGDIT